MCCSSITIRHAWHPSADRKHYLVHVKFGAMFVIYFRRKSMSNKKWHFSWVIVHPFSKKNGVLEISAVPVMPGTQFPRHVSHYYHLSRSPNSSSVSNVRSVRAVRLDYFKVHREVTFSKLYSVAHPSYPIPPPMPLVSYPIPLPIYSLLFYPILIIPWRSVVTGIS
jgi:hypothetical protein